MSDFIHPCAGSRLTSPFGHRKHPITGKVNSFHAGVDLAKTGNIPILASADGVVKQYIGDTTTYGNVIFIQHTINGNRFDTTYAHLKSKLVKDGQKVKQGQVIGYMGNTGGSTGQHLHFEIHNGPWKSGQPNAVDPMLYIDKKKENDKEAELMKELENKIKLLDEKIERVKSLIVTLEVDLSKERGLQAQQKCDWAVSSINKAIKSGVMIGDTKGNWNPNKPLTRAELAKVLDNLNLI